MKKFITFLMAATLIFGFAGISMAADPCGSCVEPGTINRACPIDEQGDCVSIPFDYEDQAYDSNYCTDPKTPRRLLFPACDCDNFLAGDTIDIRMEILVNGVTGDNGAYWAENVNSIQVGTYVTEPDACDDNHNYSGEFNGPFEYIYTDDNGDVQNTGFPGLGTWNCDDIPDAARVYALQADATAINGNCLNHGYMVTDQDDIQNRAIWAIDVPYIRFDQNIVQAGDVISVRVCLTKAVDDPNSDDPACTNIDSGGICSDTGCCCDLTLGTLGCCLEDLILGGHLIYPYATPMNSVDWWYGMVITNISDSVCEAAVTVYETNTDGSIDMATITSAEVPALAIPAHGMAVFTNTALMSAFGGDIGNGRAWFDVNGDTSISGFMFIGNDDKSEAMGYLPVSRPIYDAIVDSINGNGMLPLVGMRN